METTEKFTSADLLLMPDDGKRYEVIEGELYVSKQPGAEHQFVCGQLFRYIQQWNEQGGAGVALIAPGLVFADDEDVAPDVVWVSRERLQGMLNKAGHLTKAPELVVEVLSPGKANERLLAARGSGVLDCGLDATARRGLPTRAGRVKTGGDSLRRRRA